MNDAARRLHPALFVLILGMMQAMAPMSVDMYLPGLPALQHEFVASQSSVQLTLSAFLIGFGGGQVFWGPLGDRFGRKGPMAAGLALYVAASFGCAHAATVWQLVGWRFAEAIGGCAPAVLGAAMVRDLYGRDHSARILSLMGLVTGVAPLAAPLIGGQILAFFAWRTIFQVLTIYGTVALLGLLLLPESLPPERRPRLRLGDAIRGYGQLLRHRRYLGYALSSGLLMAGMFAYISGTPFVYIEYFHVKPQLYGLLFGLNVVGMMGAGLINSRLVVRIGADRMLRTALGISLLAGLALAAAGFSGAFGLLGLVLPIFFFVAMMGMSGPNAIAGALADFPQMAGAAAALVGISGNGLGAVAGALVGILADGSPWPMCAVMGGLGIAAFTANRMLMTPAE